MERTVLQTVAQSHSPGLHTPYKKPPQIFVDVGLRLTAPHGT